MRGRIYPQKTSGSSEGLGPLGFVEIATEIKYEKKIESYGEKQPQKEGVLKSCLFGLKSKF